MKSNRWKEAMQVLAAAQSMVPLGDNARIYEQLRNDLRCCCRPDQFNRPDERFRKAMQSALEPLGHA